MKEEVCWVDAGFACFGMVARNGVVYRVAPVCKWAKGKQLSEVVAYWKRRGAKVKVWIPKKAWKRKRL